MQVARQTDALLGCELKEEVRRAFSAAGRVVWIALVAFCVGAGVAGQVDVVLVVEPSAEVLAVARGDVEEGVGGHTLPCLHVEDSRLAQVEPASATQ